MADQRAHEFCAGVALGFDVGVDPVSRGCQGFAASRLHFDVAGVHLAGGLLRLDASSPQAEVAGHCGSYFFVPLNFDRQICP